MSFTPTTTIGKRLAEQWGPWLTDDLARVAEAIGTMCEPLTEVIEEEGYPDEAGWVPGYGKIFNPETCPKVFLAYLGMFTGTAIPIGTPEVEARALIKAESGQARGTRASVESAILRALNTPANLIPNPSFAHDTAGGEAAGWSCKASYLIDEGASTKVFVVPGYAQAASIFGLDSYCEISTVGSTTQEGAHTGEVIPCEKGVPITVYVSLYEEVKQEVKLALGSAACGFDEIVVKQAAGLGWQRHSITLTPSATGDIAFAVGTTGVVASSKKILIAAVSTVEPYVDGDTEGYVWRGVKGDSVTGKTGSGEFDLIERTEPSGVSSPYWFLVVVNGSQLVPEGNAAQLESYVNGTKPAGLKWEAVITDEAIWDEATLTWNEVGAGVLWSTVTKEQIT